MSDTNIMELYGLKGMCLCSVVFECWHVGFGKRTN